MFQDRFEDACLSGRADSAYVRKSNDRVAVEMKLDNVLEEGAVVPDAEYEPVQSIGPLNTPVDIAVLLIGHDALELCANLAFVYSVLPPVEGIP